MKVHLNSNNFAHRYVSINNKILIEIQGYTVACAKEMGGGGGGGSQSLLAGHSGEMSTLLVM